MGKKIHIALMRVKIRGADYREILLSLVGQERPSSEKYF